LSFWLDAPFRETPDLFEQKIDNSVQKYYIPPRTQGAPNPLVPENSKGKEG
jgi:hypothetical protein